MESAYDRRDASRIRRGRDPPGGESDGAFIRRVARALERIAPRLQEQRPLIVASKGVARAMCAVLGLPPRPSLVNGEITQFDLARLARRELVKDIS
jgi:broad specificity phosphatase PhoE